MKFVMKISWFNGKTDIRYSDSLNDLQRDMKILDIIKDRDSHKNNPLTGLVVESVDSIKPLSPRPVILVKEEIINFSKDSLNKINIDIIYMENKLRKDNPDLTDYTIKEYVRFYLNASKILKKSPTSRWLFKSNPNEVYDKLKEHYSDSSLSSIITSLVKILYSYGDEKKAKEYLVIKKTIPVKEVNSKSDKQKQNWISKDEVFKFLNELKDAVKDKPSFINYRQYLILLIHTKTPLRNDLAGILMVNKDSQTKDKDKNYYIKSTGTLVLNKYKTSKTYGQKKIPFSKEVQDVIKDFHDKFKGHKYLLPNENGGELTPSAISKLMIRLFKKRFSKNIGTTMLRHILLDNEDNKKFIMAKKEFIKNNMEVSDNMGHNITTHANYVLL